MLLKILNLNNLLKVYVIKLSLMKTLEMLKFGMSTIMMQEKKNKLKNLCQVNQLKKSDRL